ncbi:MAG: Flagellar basal-body rod protein FlgG [Firmicutes bacterium]|nr:Flagellar basal-body rod protein FlgG [Bacillota bacterium]
MLRGLYQATSAMVIAKTRQEMISGNVANAETPGFKRDNVAEEVFSEVMWVAELAGRRRGLGTTFTRTALSAPVTDHRQGQIVESHSPYHLALSGQGFFAVQTPEGVRYTRAGDFRVDAAGHVVDARGGRLLLSDRTPLDARGRQLKILTSGEVLLDDAPAGRLLLVEFPDLSGLIRDVNGQFQGDGLIAVASQGSVHQFMLEQSNVDIGEEIVAMLLTNRIFQSAQRIVATYDRLMERAKEIGSVR